MPRDGTNCYVCHTFVKESERKPMHESSKFQGMICTDCKTLTQYYLDIDLDLKGKVCIVTGARVKIGYHIVLWLLRHGATVVGTTRFPMDAQERYARESDYDTWSENLQLIEVDFRSSWMIANFCNIVKEKCQSLYLLVNNAAQTIKRPEYFYRDLTDRKLAITGTSKTPLATITAIEAYDINFDPVHFPDDRKDIDGQQLDLRADNSWTQKVEHVDIRECVESHLINSIAPFYIIQMLTPLLGGADSPTSHIINVTSQEGRFQSKKTAIHPHNNMTKAALNMLTRTLGLDYKNRYNCQVVSVDTGWANSMVGPTSIEMLSYFDCVARVIQPLVDDKDYSGTQLRHFKDVGFNET